MSRYLRGTGCPRARPFTTSGSTHSWKLNISACPVRFLYSRYGLNKRHHAPHAVHTPRERGPTSAWFLRGRLPAGASWRAASGRAALKQHGHSNFDCFLPGVAIFFLRASAMHSTMGPHRTPMVIHIARAYVVSICRATHSTLTIGDSAPRPLPDLLASK